MDENIPIIAATVALITGTMGAVSKYVFVSKKSCLETSGKILEKLDRMEARHLNETKELKEFMGKTKAVMDIVKEKVL